MPTPAQAYLNMKGLDPGAHELNLKDRLREFQSIEDNFLPGEKEKMFTLEGLLIAAEELEDSVVNHNNDVFSVEFDAGEKWKGQYEICLRTSDFQAAILVKCFALDGLAGDVVEKPVLLRRIHTDLCDRLETLYEEQKGHHKVWPEPSE